MFKQTCWAIFALVLWYIFLVLTGNIHAQTITNADIGKPHRPLLDARTAAKILEPHQWQPPPYVPKTFTFNARTTGRPGDGPYGELKLTPTPPASPFIAPYWATWPPYMIGGSHVIRRPQGSGRPVTDSKAR